MKARKLFNKKSYAIALLRRGSYRAPMRYQALQRAKVMYGRYTCAACEGIFARKDIQVDHIAPVVNVSGWDGFDLFIDRLFCDSEGLQVMCKPCHKAKSQKENASRPRVKRIRKKRRVRK